MQLFLCGNPSYVEIRQGLRQWGKDFFYLADRLHFPPNLSFKNSKRRHRWGFVTSLFKNKVFQKIKDGECLCWADVKWRPLISYFYHAFSAWYKLNGQLIMLLANICFPLGDAILSVGELQQRISKFTNENIPQPLV